MSSGKTKTRNDVNMTPDMKKLVNDLIYYYNVFKKFRNQRSLLRKSMINGVNLYLFFDNNDEFWIVLKGIPVWRSTDMYTEETAKLWNKITGDKITSEWLLKRVERGRK